MKDNRNIKIIDLASKNWGGVTTITFFVYSVFCYFWTITYFNSWDVFAFDYLSNTDIYNFTIVSSGLPFSLILILLTLLMFKATKDISYVLKRKVRAEGIIYSDRQNECEEEPNLLFVNALSIMILVLAAYATYNYHVKSISSKIELAKYKITIKNRHDVMCGHIISNVGENLVVWDFSSDNIVAVSKSAVESYSELKLASPPFEYKLVYPDGTLTPRKHGWTSPPPRNIRIETEDSKKAFQEWKNSFLKQCSSSGRTNK
ncbi:hypothetical protein [Pseudoalteromonas rhizosphaerae]|uniref:hypothetical protein n=1 Tax=Pseudoalteromonas rhizosphaerae TaxID=2518973 RepID=UPI00214906B5|nr:hypothetical protein [Pseudoalteromonas rhizosphaerae]|tara:strand:- start:693 stop:1472 length:780 start_codon:yes stop_codon:yes gene_type:complete